MAVNEWRGKNVAEIDKSCPHCGLQTVESVEHRFFSCSLAQQRWQYVAISCGNSMPKEVTLVRENHFLWYNDSLINICARHWNNSIAFGFSWGVVFCRIFGTNGIIWFLLLCNIPLRKCVNTRTWDDLHDYGRFEWQRTPSDLETAWMLPTKMSLTNSIRFG